jgi:hypothetical protein
MNIVELSNCPKCGCEYDDLDKKYDTVADVIKIVCPDCEYKFTVECADKHSKVA